MSEPIHPTSKERTLLQLFVDMEEVSTYADPKKYWAAYAELARKARALLSGDSSAGETTAPLPACDCDPDFGCKERDPTKFICQARKLERLARASDVASEAREPPYRIRSFWSPDKRHLVTACCSADDITLLDDNANIWEATGPEADITAPGFTEETSATLPQLEWEITYDVVAYNESWGGYGDNASKDGFASAEEAISYATPLGAHLNAVVWKRARPKPIVAPSTKIWSAVKSTSDGWCEICGGQNGEHKPGCVDGDSVL